MFINNISKSKKNIANNKGFTLVELIVVLAMMAIVLTLGGLAILKWQDYATFNQENEYAQTLFVAAQNQLSEYSASGRLEVLQSELKSGGKYGQIVGGQASKGIVLDITKLVNEDGDNYDRALVWSEAYRIDSTGGEKANKYIDDIVSLRAEAGQYNQYVNDPEGLKNSNPQAYWLFEILGSYVYDTSILNDAAICVEFTPDDGQVFSVFYSDKNNSFIYSNHETKTAGAGVADIVDRQELYRNDYMIGFYGVEKLTKSTRDKSQMAKAEIKNVMLHNENTLNLTFDIEAGEVSSLDYKVVLKTSGEYDSDSFNDELEIIIPSHTLKNEMGVVNCSVARITGTDREELGEMKFLGKLQSNGDREPQVLLVLDAADIHAQANLYRDFLATGEQYFDAFKNTYSIFRFGIEMAYSKCEVGAFGLGYLDSETAESNVEHMCAQTMVEKNIENGSGKIMEYTLTNARHLYNVKFMQIDIAKDSKHIGANYVLSNKTDTDDDGDNVIDWGRFQNNVTYNKLYDSSPANVGWLVGALPEGYNSLKTCAFPSIEEIGVNDVLTSLAQGYELKNFKLDSKSNVFYDRSKSINAAEEKAVGLVGTNKGTISNITMTNTDVRGKEYVGAISGYNEVDGVVDNCRIQNEAVNGYSSVGGIVGFNAGAVSAKSQLAEAISITPNVNGTYYVGGIVGYNDTDATITNYKINKGTITGEADTSCFVGGFVGLNSSIKLLQGADKKAIDIISNPLKVTGAYYVGGCIGGNIINTNGYSNATDGDKPGDASFTPGLNSEFKPNDLNGNLWDGNIYLHFDVYNNTGNDIKDWSLDLSWIKSICEVDFPNSSNLIIDKNNYIVRPIDHEHAKVIYNGQKQRYGEFYIHIKAPDAQKAKQIVDYIKNNGNKLGTLAFYTAKLDLDKNVSMLAMVGTSNLLFTNNGTGTGSSDISITFTTENVHSWDGGFGSKYFIKVTNNGTKKYNYNDIAIVVKFPESLKKIDIWNYSYSNDGLTYTFVPSGGNWQDLGPKATLEFSFNAVFDTRNNANDFPTVAGVDVIGEGNVLATLNGGTGNTSGGTTTPTDPTPSTPEPEKIDVINASFKNSYDSGELSGTAFVGGYIGYNMLIDSTDKNAVHDYVTKAYIDAIKNNGTLDSKYIAVDNIKISSINAGIKNSDVHMWINKSEGRVKNNIGTVTADICVGGIFGYNNDETNLTIFNSDNYSKIAARTAIEYAGEQEYVDALDANKTVIRKTDYEGKDKTYYYSYAGGIIGTNNKLTVLDNCANKSSALVVTYGTYTGGLCEINDGTIINCAVDNLGITDKEYVGGLCGLNKNTVTKCSFNTKTVGGANVVGGIAAENYGTISGIELIHPSMIAYGKTVTNVSGEADVHGLVGAYTGYNGYTGVVKVEKDIIGVAVNSSGRYAGLVIGYNSGQIENKKTDKDTTEGNVVLGGTLKAYKTAGALCGYNDNECDVANFTNITPVLTTNGEAGGIIGFNNSVNTIKFCVNEALVNASDDGNAGGITSVNNGTITNSYNHLSVNAPNGMCGGITSINYDNGNIYGCYVVPKAGTNSSITFTSKFVCGGVAAQNAGTIKDNTLINVVVKNYDNALDTKLGVVAGENLESGEILLPATPSIDNCQVIAEANDAKMGGIAGANAGLITKDKKDNEDYEDNGNPIVKCSLILDKATYASMGGVAGSNTGTISHISVDANIEGNLQAGFSGYGGIAGTSGYSLKSVASSAASVANKTYPASIIDCSFDGSIHAVGTSGNPANIGGVTGLNGYGSEINNCYLGVLDQSNSSALETVITAGDVDNYNSTNTLDIISYANVGGIAGKNYGKISNVDMESAKISGKLTDTINITAFAGASGGFVGYNFEGAIVTGSSATNRMTTTDKMTITMLRGENNRGPGGFIGVNLSGQSLSFMDNYASVNGIYKANMKTGGFMGSNMQQESYQLLITNCNNYGTIVGYANVGGFVGHDWYRGIRFEYCKNYGQVRSEGEDIADIQKLAAGFIGRPCSSTTPHSFAHCENHGYIETRGATKNAVAGGFIGEIEGNVNVAFNFYDCVNTGIVCNKDGYNDSGSIRGLGNFVGYSDGKCPLNFNLCRNYNTKKVVNGFSSSGICIDCLDVSLQMDEENYYNPYTNVNSINNYYVSKEPSELGSFETASNGAYFTVRSGERYVDGKGNNQSKSWAIKRGNFGVAYSSYKNYELLFEEPSKFSNIYSSNKEGEQPLYFTVYPDSTYSGMKDFTVYFRTPSDDLYNTTLYEYNYSITFIDANGDVINTTSGTVSDVKGSFDVRTYKATAAVPAGSEKDVRNILLKVSCKNSNGNIEVPHLFGFSWKPVGSTKENLLSGLTSYNNMASVFSGVATGISITDRAYDYEVINGSCSHNFMLTDYYKTNSNSGYKFNPGYNKSTGIRNGQTYTITNTYLNESAVNMDSINLYVSNDFTSTTANSITYSYYISLTDVEGHKYTYKDAGDKNFKIECTDQNGKIEFNVIDIYNASQSYSKVENRLTSRNIAKIDIIMTNISTKYGEEINTNNDAIFLKGITYKANGETVERNFAYADLGSSNAYPIDYNMNSRTGVYSIYSLVPENKNIEAPFLYAELDPKRGIQMEANSPILNSVYENDINALTVDRNSQSGNGYVKWVTNELTGETYTEVSSDVQHSRISVYKDIDPKFLEMINSTKTSNGKLATPRYPSLLLKGGSPVFRWERVKKDVDGKDAIPYGYEVAYEVRNTNNEVIEASSTVQPFVNDGKLTMKVIENGNEVSITLAEWAFPVTIQNEWIENEYMLNVKVRAVDAKEESKDSDWTSEYAVSLSQPLLPQPKVHIEYTSDDKMVAVLDNPEDFDEVVTFSDNGVINEAKLSDICNIIVNWDSFKYENVTSFTIDPADGNIFSKECMYISSGAFKVLSAYAEPKTGYETNIQPSLQSSLKGNFEANGVVPKYDRYTGTKITFNGFNGNGSSDLQYDISIVGGEDSFLAADFGAYDEEAGLYIYYDRATAHLGASAGGTSVTNSYSLSNIPIELFDDDSVKDMEVRVYLDESQNGVVHYGHEVVDNIVLNGETNEENYAILEDIIDANYLTTEGTKAIPIPDKKVWDSENNEFYPGYSLYLNPDGTYKVLYNATIELSMKKAIEENKVSTNVINGVERKYHLYEVDVMRYVAFDTKSSSTRKISNVTINGNATTFDMNYLQDGFYERRQSEKNGTAAYSAFNVSKFSDSNLAYKYFLDVAPAPIVEGDAMTVTVNSQGQKTYAVQWDKYYKDVNSWNGSYYAEDNNEAVSISKISYAGLEVNKLDGSEKFVLPTVDTWNEFKARTIDSDDKIFYDEYINDIKNSGKRQWNRLAMNSYYYTYANARYKAVLLGKTSSGEYVELATKDITSATKIGESEKFSYRINYNNNSYVDIVNNYYEYMAYQTEFTENNGEWGGYSDITIRIIRLGDEDNYGKGVSYPNKKDIDNGNANYLFVLPRFTEVKHEQKQPLTTLLAPSVAEHDNSVVTAEGSMLYDVSFGLINDTQMLDDLGGYLIEVKDTNTDESLTLDPIYYLIKLDGKTITNYDISDDSTVIELASGMFITNSTNGTAVIDLYDFASKEVAVSVKALARDSSDASPTKYCHGEFSDGTTLTIRDALPVPVVKDSDKVYLSVEEVKDSSTEKVLDYKLTYTDITDDYKKFYENNDTTVTIQAKVDIYDKENGDLVESLYGTDSPLDVTKFAKDGVSSSANIIGDSASYDKLFVDYAGYYMRIAIKAHSDESELVDSKWSDELTNAGMTDDMKCIWIQIPKIVIEDTSAISSITYDEMQYTTLNEDDSYKAIVDQQAFNILIDSNVDEYTFEFTSDEKADNATVPDSIAIKKVTSDEGEKWYLEDNNEITSSKIEISGFNNWISVNNDGKDFEIECKAYISIVIADDGKQYIHLIVPDALCVAIDTDNDGNFDVVENATVTNEKGFIALSTLEFVSGLNENSSKQKELADNVNKHVYKKQEELEGILSAIPAVTSEEGPDDGGVTDGAEDESTPEEAGGGDEDNDENDPVPESVLDSEASDVPVTEPETTEDGDSES